MNLRFVVKFAGCWITGSALMKEIPTVTGGVIALAAGVIYWIAVGTD